MVDGIKNILVVLFCTLLVVCSAVFFSGITKEDLGLPDTPSSSQGGVERSDHSSGGGALDSPTVMPRGAENSSESESTDPTADIEETESVNSGVESNDGNIYMLERPHGVIGGEGLLPATPIAVVKNRSGNSVQFDTCTVAFSVPGKGKYPWAITAGHCGKVGQKVYTLPTDGMFNSAVFVGTVRATSRPDSTRDTSDWAAIRLNPTAKLPDHTTKINLQLDTYPREPGDKLCKNGTTTGFNCGAKGNDDVITELTSYDKEKRKNITYTAKMSQVNLCALPGDSGSPVYDRDGIVGVLSSTSATQEEVDAGKCDKGTVAYYTPITKIIDQVTSVVDDISIE